MSVQLLHRKQFEEALTTVSDYGQLFEATLRLWYFDESWMHISAGEDGVTLNSADDYAGHPNEIPTGSPEQLEMMRQVGPNRFALHIPVSTDDSSGLFAVGTVESDLDTLVSMLAAQAIAAHQLRLELGQQEEKLDHYADQILRDFEELTWMAELTDQLDLCEVTNRLQTVAEKILPHLHAISGARALVFIAADRDRPVVHGFSPAVAEVQVRVGDVEVTDAECLQVVNQYRHEAQTQPVVMNHLAERFAGTAPAGIESFILTSVQKNDQCAGWLLAINRASNAEMAPIMACDTSLEHTANEFGTLEARLMMSASTVLATHDRNVQLFQANESLTVGVIQSLASAVDARDPYTRGHSERVSRMSRHLGKCLGLSHRECEQLLMTGLLHDIGKIGVPDAVLLKDSRLTDAEFGQIKQHPVIGHRILRHLNQLNYALPGVLHHHEAFDGSGYPDGMSGHDIPEFARIIAVVDTFDAMTSNRPYRSGMAIQKANDILLKGAGAQWDPEMIEVFLKHSDEFRAICRAVDAGEECSTPVDTAALAEPSNVSLEDLLAYLKSRNLLKTSQD